MALKPHANHQKKRFHGREIVVAARYPLAKDRQEQWRLNLQHRLVKKVLGGRNYCAPISKPTAILDIGCGTGIWPLEMARHFRQAQAVIGMDKHLELTQALLRIQKQPEDVPRSLTFQEADALQPFPFENDTFDFVHGRFMASFIPLTKWLNVLREMVRVTKPGGWIEVGEAELSSNGGPLLDDVNDALIALSEKMGIGFVAPKIPEWLQSIGVQNIQHRRILLSGNDLAKNVAEAMHSFAPALLHHKVITKEKMDAILTRFEEEALQYGIKLPVIITWGQKGQGIIHRS